MSRAGLLRLDGRDTSLVVDARGAGAPHCVHWGARLADGADLAGLSRHDAAGAARPAAIDAPLDLLPTADFGFFGEPALTGRSSGGAWVTVLRLASAVQEAERIEIACRDRTAGIAVVLDLRLAADDDVLLSRATVTNEGDAPFDLQWLAALTLPLPAGSTEALAFHGGWGEEFRTARVTLPPGAWQRASRRGRPGHDGFPALIAGEAGFDDRRGAVFGVHLGWSGNHRMMIESLPGGARQVQVGELLSPGEAVLPPGGAYRSPTAFAARTDAGLNALSGMFHEHLRRRVLPCRVASRPRPVVFNTWQALYFDQTHEALIELAERAAGVGAERFVVDDGWFAGRRDDRAALGDWKIDRTKLPRGLRAVAERVNALGMEFGLWVEPEMVNPESGLYRAHPDWALSLPGRPAVPGRNQLVLDLTRTEVWDHTFAWIDGYLRELPIASLKWDHNRDLTHAGDARGRPAVRAQTLALYRLLDALRDRHPEVEIESCASGGARIDYGILSRTHRFWTSDNTDAAARIEIQDGCSLFFPPEVMGAHVGPAPDPTTRRSVSMNFRGRTATFGHFGLELDLRAAPAAEVAELKRHVAAYKRHRKLIHGGRWHRLAGAEGGAIGWCAVSPDRTRAVALAVRAADTALAEGATMRLAGLDRARTYRVRIEEPAPEHVRASMPDPEAWFGGGVDLGGDTLCGVGVRLPLRWPETALLLTFEAIPRSGAAAGTAAGAGRG